MKFILQAPREASLFAFILGACLFNMPSAFSQITWDGGANTSAWSDAANWSGNVLPSVTDEVIIAVGQTVRVVTGTATCLKLSISGSTVAYAVTTGDAIVLINAASITGTPIFTLPRGWIGSVSGGQVRMTASSAVSVREITEGSIRISPNPTSDKVRITLSDKVRLESTTVAVYDLVGRQKWAQKMTGDILELDMSDFSKGVYLVKINTNNSIYTEKIIVQ